MSLQDVTVENLYAAILAAWINPVAGTGVEVVRTNDNAPKGQTDTFVALNLSNFSEVGMDERGDPDPTTLDVVVRGMREVTLTVDVYGTAALQLANTLRNSLPTNAVQNVLHAAGVATPSRTTILNLTALYESQWKERGQFTVLLRYRSETLDPDVGAVEKVDATVTAASPGNPPGVEEIEIVA